MIEKSKGKIMKPERSITEAPSLMQELEDIRTTQKAMLFALDLAKQVLKPDKFAYMEVQLDRLERNVSSLENKVNQMDFKYHNRLKDIEAK